MRVQLRKEIANFLFANRHIAIAEKQIDAPLDFQIQAGFVSRVNPIGDAVRSEAFLRVGDTFGVVL